MKDLLVSKSEKRKAKPDPSSTLASAKDSEQGTVPESINKWVHTSAFDQPVVLQQTSRWSRGIVWSLISVATLTVIWAAFARIERAVPAIGKLEPNEQVQEVQAPVGGVADQILVTEGEQVNKGDLLIRFDPRLTEAQQQSLQQIRDSLVQENHFYRAIMLNIIEPNAQQLNLPPEMLIQLRGESNTVASLEQQARLQVGLVEVDSRVSTVRFEVSQLRQQLTQAQGQLAAARQNSQIEQSILSDIRPLAEVGGIARMQLRRQEQEVVSNQAEVDRLTREVERLQYAIAQAQEKLVNTIAAISDEMLIKIGENDKRIAEIKSELRQAEVTLQYQELRAPIDGTVFDLRANKPGFVVNTSEPILKIVPNDGLTAEVYITNQDIGFVREGMEVDVRIDSFPFSEFGNVKGILTLIGSDALPPDEVHPYYRFPAQVKLNSQLLAINGRELPLQSGMSVTANIITTHDRTVLSIFLDQFTHKVDSLKNVR